MPAKLELMTAAFDAPEIMAVICDQETTDEDLNPSGQTSQGMHRLLGIRSHTFTVGCCTAIRPALRDFLLPLPDGIDSHGLWLDVVSNRLGVGRPVPEVLQYHRRHSSPGYQAPALYAAACTHR